MPKDREQRIVNHITQNLDYRAKEFFIKADPEINIREIAQALVGIGYSIEEYSFGEQTGKDGARLGEMHRLVIRKEVGVDRHGESDSADELDDLMKKLFGFKK